MTVWQIFIGFLIFFSMVIRPILYKPCVKYFPAELSVAFTSIWLLLALVITSPVFSPLLLNNFSKVISSPYLLLTFLKGVLLWFMIKLQQIINKSSTSSSVFWGFIALALGSLINNLFFKEGLLHFQLICIGLLGVLGLFFVVKGGARRLPLQERFYFAIIVLIGASFSVIDHLAIPQIGWYPHLLFASISMFVSCVIYGISKQDYINIFKNKAIILAGVVYATSEFLIIYTSVNIMPVSFVALFMRLATPVVMLYSALHYKEQTWKNQAAFGVIALALALPLILIKG